MPSTHPLNYTAAECLALTMHYATAPRATLLAACPGRSWKSIKDAARRLDLNRPRPQNWPPEHVAVLHAHYKTGGAALVEELTGRSRSSIYDKAWQEGLRHEVKQPEPKPKPISATKLRAEARARANRAAKQAAQAAKLAKASAPKPPKPAPKRKPAKALLDTAKGKALPLPGVPTNAATPNLNAAKAARINRERQQQALQQKMAPVTAAEVAKLPYTHPARMAYTLNARHGGAAAQTAFQAAMQQMKS